MFNQYPYLNINDLNLDYLLKAIKEMRYEVTNFVSLNAIKYADPIQWDITRQYEKNTIVIDPLTGVAYISVQPVPRGVALTREEYWTVVFDLGRFVARAAQNFTEHYEPETTLISSYTLEVDDWVVWGDVLYKVIEHISVGDYYVVGTNIEHFTMYDLYIEYLNAIANIHTKIGNLDDLSTADKSSIVNAINDEVQARQNADVALQDAIDDEVQARQDADDLKANLNEVIKVVNMRERGCTNDGSIDVSPIIANIIDEVPAGSTLYFEHGTYLLNAPIDVTKRIQILGDGGNGYDAPTIFKVTNNGFYLKASGIVLNGFKVVADAHCAIGIGIYDSWCRLHDIDVDDATHDLTKYFDVSYQCGDVEHGFWFEHLDECNVNNRYDDGQDPQSKMKGKGFSFLGAVNSLLTNCFASKKQFAFYFENTPTDDGYYSDGVTFSNTNVVWCDFGVYCLHATTLHYSNTIIDQCNHGIYFDYARNIEIVNIHIGQNNSGGAHGNMLQTTSQTQYLVVTNCDIFGQGADTAFYVGNAKDCIFNDIFIHNFTYGMNIGTTAERVTGNNICCDNVQYGVVAFAVAFFEKVTGATTNYSNLAFANQHIETIDGTIDDLGTNNFAGLVIHSKYNKVPDNVLFTVRNGGTLSGTKAVNATYRKDTSTATLTSILLYSCDNSVFNNESLNYTVTLIYDN